MAKGTKPQSESPKSDNITVLVTGDLRKRIEKIRGSAYPQIPLNQFLAHLVDIGAEEEETRIKEHKARNAARVNAVDINHNPIDYSQMGKLDEDEFWDVVRNRVIGGVKAASKIKRKDASNGEDADHHSA
jgi:hypothetical protein